MKKLLALFLSSVLVFSLAACGSGSSSNGGEAPAGNPVGGDDAATAATGNVIEIMFWTMWDGGDVEIAGSIVDEYNALNDGVNITFQQQDFNQYATKLRTGMLGNDGPDLAISYLGGFVNGLKDDGALVSISAEAERLGVDIDFGNYTPEAMAQALIDGEYWVVPTDNLVRVLMYNKALLEDTGYLADDGSLIYDDGYAGFTGMLADVQGQLGTSALALTMRPPQQVLGFLTTYAQMGGSDFIDNDAKAVVWQAGDRETAIAALTNYRDIYQNYVPENLTPPADLEMFSAGELPFYIDGAWNVTPAAAALGDDFGVTTFPVIGEKNAMITTNHGFIIPQKGDMTDEKTTEILKFIQWWGENNWKWSEAGHLPAYTPSTETAEFAAMPWPSYYQSTLDVAIPIYTIFNANLHQISDTQDPIAKAMRGDITPEAAIDELEENLNALIPSL